MSLSLRRYDPGIHPTLCYYMALAGLTGEQIADQLGINRASFFRWVMHHPELREAMKPGKDFIDNLVEGSLLKRALGYDYEEVTKERAVTKLENGLPVKWGMRVTKKVTKHLAGEVGAQAFWLKNRKGWKDRSEVSHEVKRVFDFAQVSDEKLSELESTLIAAEVSVANRN